MPGRGGGGWEGGGRVGQGGVIGAGGPSNERVCVSGAMVVIVMAGAALRVGERG